MQAVNGGGFTSQRTTERQLPAASVEHTSGGGQCIKGYTIGPTLGRGAFAKVKLGVKDGQKYALKIASKSYLAKMKENYRDDKGELKVRSVLDKVYVEMDVLAKLDHPRIVKLVEAFEDEFEDKIYMVLQYAEKGVIAEWDEEEDQFKIMYDAKKDLDEVEIKRILLQAIDALEYRNLG